MGPSWRRAPPPSKIPITGEPAAVARRRVSHTLSENTSPCDPPKTSRSWTKTNTWRPSTVPNPATTPSVYSRREVSPRPDPRRNSPSSTNESLSTSVSRRWRLDDPGSSPPCPRIAANRAVASQGRSAARSRGRGGSPVVRAEASVWSAGRGSARPRFLSGQANGRTVVGNVSVISVIGSPRRRAVAGDATRPGPPSSGR